MPGIDYRAVREAVPMEKVLELLHFVAIKVRGDEHRGPCPVHRSRSSTSRVFSVNLRDQTYRCFRCDSEGNQLDLWAKANRLGLHAAAENLCQRAGVDVPWIHRW